MKPEDFKYETTQQFVKDSDKIEDFNPQVYTEIDESFDKDLTKEEQESAVTVPLKITSFPWNPKFEGLVFMMGKVSINESEDGESAQLTYNYSVLKNPNELDLAQDEDEMSRDTEDNELLDVFIGRMVESMLYSMSQDKDFLERMEKEAKANSEDE